MLNVDEKSAVIPKISEISGKKFPQNHVPLSAVSSFPKRMDKLQQQLIVALQQPLPGREAHFRMAPAPRRQNMDAPAGVYHAAVLMLLYPKNNEPHLVLIERTSHNERDRHRGQIGLPGGRREDVDRDFSDTARREAEEEVGIVGSEVDMLGKLSPLYIPVSNFEVHSYVGTLDYAPDFTPQASEVNAILEIPLREFLDPKNHRARDMPFSPNLIIRHVPYFCVGDNVTVWGATAMMLSELVWLLGKPVAENLATN